VNYPCSCIRIGVEKSGYLPALPRFSGRRHLW
jgi:hypothetical protein